MTRSTWHGWAWAGFLAGMIGTSFLGCYGSLKAQPGSCEDDGNPCTVDTCDANGNSIHTPVSNADKTQCFLGENEGVCQDGSCELTCKTQMTPCKCVEKADCPMDTACATWTCTAGECVSTAMMEGMTADPLQPGDCQKRVCQGGSLKVVDDPMDTPTDVKGDCQDPVCNAGVPGTMTNDNDVPMNDVNGDCMKPTCNGGAPGAAVDDMDPPAPTECSTFFCNLDGTSSTITKPVGNTCSDGPMGETRACDKLGMCVACLPAGKDDYDKCKMNNGGVCPIKLCVGEMASNASDCQSGFIADKVCCENTCTDECKSCALPGMEGKCTNVPYYGVDYSFTDPVTMTPNLTCDNAARCDGVGKCLRIVGTVCVLDSQCIGGKCAMPAQVCLGAPGEICNGNTQCVSMMCAMGVCK